MGDRADIGREAGHAMEKFDQSNFCFTHDPLQHVTLAAGNMTDLFLTGHKDKRVSIDLNDDGKILRDLGRYDNDNRAILAENKIAIIEHSTPYVYQFGPVRFYAFPAMTPQ
jgi:hypothetical protein